MAYHMKRLSVALAKLVPIVLVLMIGFAWAEDRKTLSKEELETLIKGCTRVGTYPGGTYYITFKKDGEFCLRLDRKEGPCYEDGPWWFEENSVCRNSPTSGEYCWSVTKIADNKYNGEITRVGKDCTYKVGTKSRFRME